MSVHYQKTAVTEILNGGSVQLNECPNNSKEEDPIIFIESEDEPGQHHFSISASQYSKHILLIGGIGSGKTNTFNHIIRQTIDRMNTNDVAFIFDTKGDFQETFYEGPDYGHYLIGNGAKYRDITSCWNIYKELTFNGQYVREDSDLAAKEIASQLFKGTGGQGNEFFETTAADLFAIKLIDTLRRGDLWDGQSPEQIREARRVRKMEWNNEALLSFFCGPFMKEYPSIIARNDDFGFAKGYLGVNDGGIVLTFSSPQIIIVQTEEGEELPFEDTVGLHLFQSFEVQYQSPVEDIQREIEELREAIEDMKSQREELEQTLASLKTEAERLRGDLEILEAEKAQKIQEMQEAQESINNIHFSMEDIQNKIDQYLEIQLQKHLSNPLVELDEEDTRKKLADFREHLVAMGNVSTLLEQPVISDEMSKIQEEMERLEKSLADIIRVREQADAIVRQSLSRSGAKN